MNRFIFSAKLFITIGLMSIIGCTTEKEKSVTLENQSASFQLFEVLSPETTGLTFNNLINESPAVNGVLYEYLYNGGGVAAGDFNNDGWQDLFFTSNLNQDEILGLSLIGDPLCKVPKLTKKTEPFFPIRCL